MHACGGEGVGVGWYSQRVSEQFKQQPFKVSFTGKAGASAAAERCLCK